MSGYESNHDNPDRKLAALDVLQSINDARIPDTIPDEIDSTYRQILRSRGAINGSYFIDTTRVETPYLDVPLEREHMQQIFGVVGEEGELEAIKYVNVGGYPRIIVNAEVFGSIDTNDISILDLTDFDEIAGVIYGLDDNYILPEDIQDDPYQMPLMQSAIKWIIDKKAMSGVEVRYRHYLIEKMGSLITVDITSQSDGTKRIQISVDNELSPMLPELSVITDRESGETFIQRPEDTERARQAGSMVKILLGDSVLFH